VDQSFSVLWIGKGTLFLMSNRIHPILLSQRERLTYTACHEHICVICIRFLLLDVHRFESSRLLDMNNHLSYDSQHVISGWN
jgi:hypothetical protein